LMFSNDIKLFLEKAKTEEQETPRETQTGEKPDFFISIEPKSIDAKPGDTLDFRIKVRQKVVSMNR